MFQNNHLHRLEPILGLMTRWAGSGPLVLDLWFCESCSRQSCCPALSQTQPDVQKHLDDVTDSTSCLSPAGAGERRGAPQEAGGGAGGPEAALPSNRGEGGGPTGPAGAGGHHEPAEQVRIRTLGCFTSLICLPNCAKTAFKHLTGFILPSG